MTPCEDAELTQNTENLQNFSMEDVVLENNAETIPMDPASHAAPRGKVTIMLNTCSIPITNDPTRLSHATRLGSPPLTKPHIGQFIHIMWPNNENICFEVRVIRYHSSSNQFDVLCPYHTGPYIETVDLNQR